MMLKNMRSFLNATIISGNWLYNLTSPLPTFNNVFYLIDTQGTEVTSIRTDKMCTPMRQIGNLITSESINGGTSTYPSDCVVGFGSGTTPVTEDDFRLEEIIASNLSLTIAQTPSFSVNSDRTKGIFTNVVVLTVTNVSTIDTETIGEVGFYLPIWYSSSSNGARKLVLLHREVLGTPITLAPNETKTLTFTLKHENSIV